MSDTCQVCDEPLDDDLECPRCRAEAWAEVLDAAYDREMDSRMDRERERERVHGFETYRED